MSLRTNRFQLASLLAVLVMGLILAACGGESVPPATADPNLPLGEAQVVEQGGFSFQTVEGYQVELGVAQATTGNGSNTIFISMLSEAADEPLEDALGKFLGKLTNSMDDFQFNRRGYTVTVGGVEGLGVDVSGAMFGEPVTGRVVAVSPGNARHFFALGVGFSGPDLPVWEDEGAGVFATVMSTVSFFEPVIASGSCRPARDASYGYLPDNPIHVGGGDADGPAREKAYLDNLRGPNGEEVAYEQTGNRAFGDLLLHVFEVEHPDTLEPVVLYIDVSSFEPLYPPSGFTCADEAALPEAP